MQKYSKLPAMTGEQLLTLLVKDGWRTCGRKTHGIGITKNINGRNIVSVIPTKPLVDFVLSAILGPKQTGIGKKGLLELLNKYGL